MVLHHACHLDNFPPGVLVVLGLAAALPLTLLFLRRVLCPTIDPREPPALWPRIPFVGHAISILREGGGYFDRLYNSAGMPACTLPVLTDKLYVLNSVALISAALRCPNLTFDPFIVLFSKNALATSSEDMARFKDPGYIHSTKKHFHPSLSGEPLREVACAALKEIARDLNRLGAGGGVVEVPHVGKWLAEVISLATMAALYGSRNPFTLERVKDVWEFDRKITVLTFDFAPRLLAPEAVAARSRIQAALKEYYLARHDQEDDVSAFVKNRAASKRQRGIPASDLASGEGDIPWVSLTNTIPSLVWVFVSIFSRPDYTERVRQETAKAATVDADSVEFDVAKLSRQPFINACVQEVQRLYNKLCGYRRVLEDTVLRDCDGREYLLRKGSNAQWSHGVPHLSRGIWGEDALSFNPERFIDTPADEEKKRRAALIPFGGGKHLCPGRRFAVTEIMCMVGAIALMFDVDGVVVPPAQAGYAGCAMANPAWEPGRPPAVRFKRREGWEKRQLKFVF